MKNITKLRIIDRYCGVVICFVLSLINAVSGLIFKTGRKIRRPHKFLLLIISEMGASILALALIEKIKEQYPHATVTIMTFDTHARALKQLSLFRDISFVTVETRNIFYFLGSNCAVLAQNFCRKYDVVFDLELFSRYSSIVSFLSCAPTRIAFSRGTEEGLYRGSLHTHKVFLNIYQHIAQNMRRLLHCVDKEPNALKFIKEKTDFYDVQLPQEKRSPTEIDHFKNTVLRGSEKKYVIFHPGIVDALPLRRWPMKHYEELSVRLKNLRDVEIVFIGEGAERIHLCAGSGPIDLIGKLSIADIVNLFHASELFVSHDCGLTHIASLTPIHIVTFFGPETPLLYRPLSKNLKVYYEDFACSPCLSAANHRNSLCDDNQCVSSISVDSVYEHICQHLGF